jgi:shikimate dehydrogenase
MPSLRVTGHTALLGVLGDPVRHSLSPVMHNAALAALGLDWIYLALPAPAADLDTILRALEAMDCRGLNVTLPHKQAAARLAAELTPLARRLEAVNTLVPRSAGGWLGANTDVEGFLAPLQSGPVPAQAVVLGCGGSARAVVAGLVDLGVERVRIVGRRSERLADFLEGCRAWAPGLEGLTGTDGDLLDALAGADLLVNTTPVGMTVRDDATAPECCPLTEEQLTALRPGSIVYDLIYTPRPTSLLRRAALRGARTIDGLEMLVCQGAASLRLWTGLAAVPVAEMRSAAQDALAAHNLA